MSETTIRQESIVSSIQGTLDDFRQRMDDRLRAEARRSRRARVLGWSALILALAAAVSTGGLLYFAFHQDLPLLTATSLRAREVVLVDRQGVERGYWAVDEQGAARLVLVDPNGVERMRLTVRADGEQGLSMADEKGANRVVLSHLSDRSSSLAFADAVGTTRAVLGMSAGDAASLLFADANGGARAALGLSATGTPTFWWPELEESAGAPAGDASGNP